MRTDIQEHRAGSRLFLNFRWMPVLLLVFVGGLPLQAGAATADARFKQYITDICNGKIAAASGVVWDTATLNTMCSAGFFLPNGAAPVSVGTGSGGASRNNKFREQLDDEKEKSNKKGASADGGKWGLLFAPQYGKSSRPETELESGFNSALKGIAIGLDYRFSDTLVSGALLGHTRDNATFLNSTSSLKTSNNTLTLYGTWLPSDSMAVDGYLGYGQVKFASQRHIVLGSIDGIASGNVTGKQTMAGLAASYQQDFGRVNLSPFINLDGVKTTFDGYNETGATTLELHYSERSVLSVTSSLGARASTTHGYDWGTLIPSLRVAAVHEYQNNVSQTKNELISAPGSGYFMASDAPDRNYLTAGLGVAAALNGGAQLFLNYEKRMKDKLLNSWAVSAGVLVEF